MSDTITFSLSILADLYGDAMPSERKIREMVNSGKFNVAIAEAIYFALDDLDLDFDVDIEFEPIEDIDYD